MNRLPNPARHGSIAARTMRYATSPASGIRRPLASITTTSEKSPV